MMNPAVWPWEVPLYFDGGIAAGSAFVGGVRPVRRPSTARIAGLIR